MKREVYEGSPADRANDKRQAKKHGMSMKAWERSASDAQEDARYQDILDAKGSMKVPDHHFAHGRPVTG